MSIVKQQTQIKKELDQMRKLQEIITRSRPAGGEPFTANGRKELAVSIVLGV